MSSAELVSPRATLRLAIVEDESLMRDLLAQVMGAIPGITVVGAYAEADAAEQGLQGQRVDVVLLDIHLGAGRNGIELGLALRRQHPRLGLVLLSNQRDASLLSALPEAQAHGWSYLNKAAVRDVVMLERAVRGAAEGMVVLDPEIAQQLVSGRRARVELTDRMQRLLALVAQGYSNASIARELCLAEKSVENMLSQLYRQLGIDTSDPRQHPRVQATLRYLLPERVG